PQSADGRVERSADAIGVGVASRRECNPVRVVPPQPPRTQSPGGRGSGTRHYAAGEAWSPSRRRVIASGGMDAGASGPRPGPTPPRGRATFFGSAATIYYERRTGGGCGARDYERAVAILRKRSSDPRRSASSAATSGSIADA